MKDYYSILGLNRSASQQDIKKAYRSLARKYHPDVNPGDLKAEEKFKEVNEAYNVLNDEQSKKAYDDKLDGNMQNGDNIREGDRKKRQNPSNSDLNQKFDFGNIERDFEKFFGFNPKTKETSIKKDQKNSKAGVNNFFEQYFMPKKK